MTIINPSPFIIIPVNVLLVNIHRFHVARPCEPSAPWLVITVRCWNVITRTACESNTGRQFRGGRFVLLPRWGIYWRSSNSVRIPPPRAESWNARGIPNTHIETYRSERNVCPWLSTRWTLHLPFDGNTRSKLKLIDSRLEIRSEVDSISGKKTSLVAFRSHKKKKEWQNDVASFYLQDEF